MSLKPAILKTQFTSAQIQLPRDLGDGVVLRVATPDDAEPLAQFNGRIHGRERFDELVEQYTREFMSDAHPAVGPSNVLIVEDARAGKIVSTTILIPQTWTYAGIPFGVGRPEMVGTDPAYRRRGLVRAQFEVVHAMSAAMGHLVQGITGIPWYYRQFEYEYAMDLGGGRLSYYSNTPVLKEGEAEPYRLRAMTLNDVPFAAPLYDHGCARWLVACPRPDWLWRHWLTYFSAASVEHHHFQIVETADGRPVGYIKPTHDIWGDAHVITELEVVPGQSLRAAMPGVLRALKRMAEAEAAQQQKTANALYFALGRAHPLYEAIPDLLPKARVPYGWYIRVADVPAFLRHITPALDARLAHSATAGYSGEVKINEYTRGLRLIFENGKLTNAEAWQPTDDDRGDAAFPPLVFLQLLFGRRSLDELRAAYPDCGGKDETAVLIDALFPQQSSCVIPVA